MNLAGIVMNPVYSEMEAFALDADQVRRGEPHGQTLERILVGYPPRQKLREDRCRATAKRGYNVYHNVKWWHS
jgi:hypothetical protein